MNVLFGSLLFFVSVSSISGGSSSNYIKYRDGQRFFVAPDKNGKLHIVDAKKRDFDDRFTAETDVNFLLYTRSNPDTPYILANGDDDNLAASFYNKNKDTKIISHGWNNDGRSELNSLIRDAYLATMDVNIICIDWGLGSNGLYGTAVANVPKVAIWTAKLVDWLVDKGSSVSSFHIMGHSLGAHIVGIAARTITKGKIPYITGFDPASPSWGPGTDRIRPSDAFYVEIIHTTAGYLGIKEAVGHNDFYPNKGMSMPGCAPFDLACSHGKSYEYFADSIDHTKFVANQCIDESEALDDKCSNLSQLYMGGSQPKEARGIFLLKTNAEKPYYQG